MSEFLTTKGATAKIEEIIYQAKSEIILCSPYLQINDDFYDRLFDANEKGIDILFVYGKNELNQKEEEKINSLKNAKKYYSENLHAKCYTNERTMLITSMNFYDFSMKNNKEMGISISRDNDKELFENAMNEVQSILRRSINETKIFCKSIKQNTTYSNKGYCIRCGERIELNKYKPLCNSCFKTWASFGNENYIESYCHFCGQKTDSSVSRPLCYSCYKNN